MSKKQQTSLILEGYQTLYHTLSFHKEPRKDLRMEIKSPLVSIYYPEQFDIESAQIQTNLQQILEHIWTIEAHTYLPKQIHELARQHQLVFTKLLIKKIKSFWGKCTGKVGGVNIITLNIYLMTLPNELIEYVLLHELCHIRHKNHGPDFWTALDLLTSGKARSLDKQLRNHHIKN